MKTWGLVTAAMLLSALFAVVLALPDIDPTVVVLVSNGGQLAAATAAAVACAWAGVRRPARQRRGWRALAFGTGAWAVGQLVWSYYEVVLGEQVPFPSLADVGFLLFPVASAVGLVSWLGTQGALVARGRDILDGAIIAGSLLTLSWVTALGSVVDEAGSDWLSITLSLAYPCGDVLLATLALLALSRGAGTDRASLLLLTAGLAGLAAADSAYVYLVSIDHYTSADLISTGWLTGFFLVAAGAVSAGTRTRVRTRALRGKRRRATGRERAWLRLLLPYPPLVAAGVVTCISLLTSATTPTVDLGLGVVLVSLVLVRQLLALNENQRLLLALQVAREELQHQARHDPLTGLANRAYFADRLEAALEHDDHHVAVLFCDLDDFKNVNDAFGHEAGDALLCMVAQRLRHCVRPEDTVARLGGDEFAILLHHAPDAELVAHRLVSSVGRVYEIGDGHIRTSISVGIADRPAGPHGWAGFADTVPPSSPAQRLLRHADIAMYAAKTNGKSRAVHVGSRERLVRAVGDEAPGVSSPPPLDRLGS